MTDTGINALTEPYYECLRRGELVLQHCRTCDRKNMYPRHACPFCYGTDLDWVRTSGTGTLHSFAVQRMGAPGRFAEDVPYAVGVVKLDDGVQLLGRLWPDTDGEWNSYSCDCLVEFHSATMEEAEQRPVAWFRRR